MQTCAGKEAPSLREASSDERERASLVQKMQPEERASGCPVDLSGWARMKFCRFDVCQSGYCKCFL